MEKNEYDSISTESGSYRTQLNKMYGLRKPWKKSNPKQILSFMPGTVGAIYVKAGDQVQAGDRLLVFRAMKMENRILAPMNGEIKKICVSPGENLAKDIVMIQFK